MKTKQLTVNLLLMIFFACNFNLMAAKNKSITQKFQVSNFQKIEVSTGINVELILDDTESAQALCDESDMKNLRIRVKGNTLYIEYVSKRSKIINNSDNEGINVTVHAKKINEMTTSSAGHIWWDKPIETDAMTIECSSAGRVSGDLSVRKLNVDLSSSGSYKGDVTADEAEFNLSSAAKATVTGKIKELEIDASSSAAFKGNGLSYENARTMASSVGKIYLDKSGKLKDKTSKATGVFINED